VGAVGALGLLGILASPHPAVAKGAYWEIRNRCPCAGPSLRTFWTSRDERMSCVDAVLDELRAASFPESILARDREREVRSRCGDPRYQCDGTPSRPCPGRSVCELTDSYCDPAGVAGVCLPRRELRRTHGCRDAPRACACDGTTHATSCKLWRAGGTLAHEGTCDEGCGGPDALPCPSGTYCLAWNCADDGGWGRCVPPPHPCYPTGPVCGCDRMTYSNECNAYAAGVMVRYYGVCEDGEP
jgi:hypothetical protein